MTAESSDLFSLLLAQLWDKSGTKGLIMRQVKFTYDPSPILFLAVDPQGRRHVLAPIPEDYAFKPIRGESLELSKWLHPITGIKYLDLICDDEVLSEPFEKLTDSIIARIEVRESPHIAIQSAIKDMKSLLKLGRLLSEEKARGLYGELIVLGWLVTRNQLFAMESWNGPDGALHDFASNRRDLEVKSSGSDSLSVMISSLRQLDEVGESSLVLIRLFVPSAPEGQNLEEVVNSLVQSGCNRGDLVEKLEMAGFRLGIDSDEHRFVYSDEYTAWKIGSDFPGLRSADLPKERAEAISQVTYTLDLRAAPGEMTPAALSSYLDEMMAR